MEQKARTTVPQEAKAGSRKEGEGSSKVKTCNAYGGTITLYGEVYEVYCCLEPHKGKKHVAGTMGKYIRWEGAFVKPRKVTTTLPDPVQEMFDNVFRPSKVSHSTAKERLRASMDRLRVTRERHEKMQREREAEIAAIEKQMALEKQQTWWFRFKSWVKAVFG